MKQVLIPRGLVITAMSRIELFNPFLSDGDILLSSNDSQCKQFETRSEITKKASALIWVQTV